MKMTRYSEPKILSILRQAEGGVPVSELCSALSTLELKYINLIA